MQETRNNCFGSKKRRTTLLQLKTGKHECRNVTATYLFSPEEGSCYVFSTRNNCCKFLAFYGFITLIFIQSFLKMPVCSASLSQLTNSLQKYKQIIHIAQKKEFLSELNVLNLLLVPA